MNYHRYFIPLMPDSKGFELKGKTPLGRCVLEERGKSSKLSLWVQDLKPGTPYRIVLVLSEMGNHTGVILGTLYVDVKGKGEFKHEFDSFDLADGQGLSRLSTVVVMAAGGNELLSPLVGYKDGPVLWKNHFSYADENIKSDAAKPIKPRAGGDNSLQAKTEENRGDREMVEPWHTLTEPQTIGESRQDALINPQTVGEKPAEPLDTQTGPQTDIEDSFQTEPEETYDDREQHAEPEDRQEILSQNIIIIPQAEPEKIQELLQQHFVNIPEIERERIEVVLGRKMLIPEIEPNNIQEGQEDTANYEIEPEIQKVGSEPNTIIPEAEPEEGQVNENFADDYPFMFFPNEGAAVQGITESEEIVGEDPYTIRGIENENQEFGDVKGFSGNLTNETCEDNTNDPSDLEEIFKNNIEITPFESKSPDILWVRISLREPAYLPIDYRFMVNHPMIISAYKKYNHLIMGRITNKGKTEYVLGVPGIYEPQYVSAAQQMGFTQFKTIMDNGVLNPGDYGYWLALLRYSGEH